MDSAWGAEPSKGVLPMVPFGSSFSAVSSVAGSWWLLTTLLGMGCERSPAPKPHLSPEASAASTTGADAALTTGASAALTTRAEAPSTSGDPSSGSLTQRKTFTTSSGVEMVLVPAGKFVMGDATGLKDEQPTHEVSLSAFFMDRFEVTQGHFAETVGYNPAKRERPQDAVDQVRWTEAIDYCNGRSKREGLETCYDLSTGRCRFEADGYRLPTEAEWEYACRAGTTTRYFFGEDASGLGAFAWFEKNAPKDSRSVGAKKPNPWGLYDMAGSLLEWCNDPYDAGYYAASPSKDPVGPPGGKDRVLRGGCWRMGAQDCRSAVRFHDEPSNADSCFGWDSYGFRCVRKAEPAK
jgi:formylglycine-generating enzyme required for sulfatase activity